MYVHTHTKVVVACLGGSSRGLCAKSFTTTLRHDYFVQSLTQAFRGAHIERSSTVVI